METTTLYVLALLGVLVGGESVTHNDNFVNRWRRQALPCQPGDEACQRCSSCSTVETSHLPECCEAYKACCDEYFQACKQCSNVASLDHYFPEYCCASFTDCCDLITTFTAQIKPPAPVRPKPKSNLKIPQVAAPKPTSFPGSVSVNSGPEGNVFTAKPSFAQQGQGFSPQESVFTPQTPAVLPREPVFATQTPSTQQQRPSFTIQNPVGAAPAAVDNSQRQRTRTQARAQARPQTRGRQQASRRPQKDGLDLQSRRGRVTSRGRVAA